MPDYLPFLLLFLRLWPLLCLKDFLRSRKLAVFLLDAQSPTLGIEEEKEDMHQLLKDFLLDGIRQLFGWGKPREGQLVLTHNAVTKMHEHQLTEETLKDVFARGEEVNQGDKMQVTRSYATYSVGLWYKTIYTPSHHHIRSEKRFLIITCWKGVGRV